MAWPGEGLPGFLARLVPLGRSSRYDLRRHAALSERPADLSPRGAAALSRDGRLRRLAGDDEGAQARFRQALSEQPGRADALAGLWELDAAREDADDDGIDAAVDAEPGRAAWRAWRGLRRLLRGEAAGARRDLRAAESASGPAAVIAGAGLAQEALGRGRARDCLELLDRAVRRAPREGWLRRLRAKARWRAGDRAGFAADCESELLRDEGLGTFALALGVSGGYSPRELAERADRELGRGGGEFWLLALRGDCRRSPEIGDERGGLADLEEAARRAARPGWVLGHVARARLAAGDGSGARRAADEAVSREPACGWLRAWRGELRRKSGDVSGAIEDLDAALALDPDYELAWAWRGAARRERGQLPESRADLDVSVRLAPALGWAWAERARVLTELGLREAAESSRRAAESLSGLAREDQSRRELESTLRGALDI